MLQNMLDRSYLLSRTSWYDMFEHDSSLTPIFCCLLSFNNTNYLAVMQDISLGVALGSATQISMFVVRLKNPRQTKSFAKLTLERNHDNFFFFCGLQVPLCVVVAWTMNIHMDLDFSLLETGSLAFTIIITAFTLQVLSSDIFLITSVDACYIGY